MLEKNQIIRQVVQPHRKAQIFIAVLNDGVKGLPSQSGVRHNEWFKYGDNGAYFQQSLIEGVHSVANFLTSAHLASRRNG